MSITEQKAYTELDTLINNNEYKNLSSDQKIKKLFDLANNVSIDASGKVTVLYSGAIDKPQDGSRGTSANDIIEKMLADGQDVRVINKTDAANFLTSEKFERALADVAGIKYEEWEQKTPLNDPIKQAAKVELQNKLFHATEGPWAVNSERFLKATVGEIRVLAPYAPDNRTFALVEIKTALDVDSRVTHIEGVPVDELRSLIRGNDYSDVIAKVRTNSLHTVTVSNIRNNIQNIDDWLKSSPQHYGDAGKINSFVEDLSKYSDAELAELKASRKLSSGGIANKLGWAGDLLDFGLSAVDALKAIKAGDNAKAKEIMKTWAISTTGSIFGALIAETLAAAAVGIAATVGATVGVIISLPVASIIIFSATIIGGFFGGDLLTEYYPLFWNEDGKGSLDFIDRFDHLLFGVEDWELPSKIPTGLGSEKLTIESTMSVDEIIANAKTNIAWRYAVRYLNPLVVTGIDYSIHNINGYLDYDSMSDSYWRDRAQMLYWRIQFNKTGKNYYYELDTGDIVGNWDFVDYASPIKGSDHLTLSIDGEDTSKSDHQIVFASDKGGEIKGSGDSDRLYGGLGKDTLIGNNGDDYLEGGKGDDIYIVGQGHDLVYDADGDGIVYYNGQILSFDNEDLWVNVSMFGDHYIYDQKWELSFTLLDEIERIYTLKINAVGDLHSSVTIKNYKSGDLGIKGLEDLSNTMVVTDSASSHNPLLNAAEQPQTTVTQNWKGGYAGFSVFFRTPPKEDETISLKIAGAVPDGMWININNERYLVENGQIIFKVTKDNLLDGGLSIVLNTLGLFKTDGKLSITVNYKDTLNNSHSVTSHFNLESSPDGLLETYNKIEIEYAPAKTDENGKVIKGDLDENDQPYHATSGTGTNDLFIGTEKDDWIIAKEGGHDRFEVGEGNDGVLAGDGNDILIGGEGRDVLLGGKGNDLLFAGEYRELTDETLKELQEGKGEGTGEWGNWLNGMEGNDTLVGSEGDDTLFGGEDDDLIMGGTGNDIIYGDQSANAGSPLWYLERTDSIYRYYWKENEDEYNRYGWKWGWTNYTNTVDGNNQYFVPYLTGGNDRIYGGEGNDIIWGEGGNDFIDGGEGDDWIDGGTGSNIIYGGGGNDILFACHYISVNDIDFTSMQGNNIIHGGDGNDRIMGGNGSDQLFGDDGDDAIFGDTRFDGTDTQDKIYGNDYLLGGNGNDRLYGSGGDDELYGGEGNDELYGDDDLVNTLDLHFGGKYNGKDKLYGGNGNDRISGGGNDDIIYGEEGDDIIFGDLDAISDEQREFDKTFKYQGNDYIDGGEGNDIIIGGAGNDFILGGEGDDTIIGEANNVFQEYTDGTFDDTIDGGEGDDFIVGGQGNDVLIGGTGNDDIYGDSGDPNHEYTYGTFDDTIDGGEGDDEIIGGQGSDIIHGGSGNDLIIGDRQTQEFTQEGNYDDVIYGDGGDDEIQGGQGNDRLHGGEGNDTIFGEGGNDYLSGGDGDDILIDKSGENVFHGGKGFDSFTGDSEQDTYIFNLGDAQGQRVDSSNNYMFENIYDTSNNNILKFGAGITKDSLKFYKIGGQIFIQYSQDDGVFIDGNIIERIIFADGSNYSYNEFLPKNTSNSSGSTGGSGGNSGGAINEPEENPTSYNQYVLGQQRGSIRYEPIIGLTPATTDGTQQPILIGWKAIYEYDGFNIPPAVYSKEIPTQFAYVDEIFSLALPKGYFIDVNNDQLTYTVSSYNNWLQLNVTPDALGMFGSTNTQGNTRFELTADDGRGGTASLNFDVVAGIRKEQQTEYADVIIGNQGGDTIVAGDNDTVYGRDGDDHFYLSGSSGLFKGGEGIDTYHVLKDQSIVINDDDRNSILKLGEGLRKEDMRLQIRFSWGDIFIPNTLQEVWEYVGSGNLMITFNGSNTSITLEKSDKNSLLNSYHMLNEIHFADGEVINGQNLGIASFPVKNDYNFVESNQNFLINQYPIFDPEVGFTNGVGLTFLEARLEDGTPLPDWIKFDPITGSLSGIPPFFNEWTDFTITIKVRDKDGVDGYFDTYLSIPPSAENHAPEIIKQQQNITLNQNDLFIYQIPHDLFTDSDAADILNYRITLANGDPLPTWLSYDAASHTLMGVPDNNQVGNLQLKIIATDQGGLSAEQSFNLTVNNVNDAPVVISSIDDVAIKTGETLNWALPTNAFKDIDKDDVLSYSISLANGSALPSWLHFDPTTGLLSGTPLKGHAGDLSIKVTATDKAGANVSTYFGLSIEALANNAPTTQNSQANISLDQNQAWSYQLSSALFSDPDGDALQYDVVLANGDPLPSWLYFDPDTRTLSGTPDNDQVGDLQLKIIATDQGGLSAEQSFNLTVNNVNDAPVAEGVLDNQSGKINELWQFELPNGSFTDIDKNDRLNYSLRMADGSAVPAWLTIDPTIGKISGTADTVGLLNLLIVATDLSGAEASHQLTVEFKSNVTSSEIIGTESDDFLFGTVGNDAIYGGDGDDFINSGGDGDDILDGGAGNDTLIGGAGKNTYIFGYGSGQDIMYGYYHSDQTKDIIQLNSDVNESDILLSGGGMYGDLIISIRGTTDTFTISNYFSSNSEDYFSFEGGAMYPELEIHFNNGTVWDMAQIAALLNRSGTDENDTLYGTKGDDEIHGGKGNDLIVGGDGDDLLYGDEGNDSISGNSGNDTLIGGAGMDMLAGNEGDDILIGGTGDDWLYGGQGNDQLYGGQGNDTYIFEKGHGQDVIEEDSSNLDESEINIIQFLDVNSTDVKFGRKDNDLILFGYNGSDTVTIQKFFQNRSYEIEYFNFADQTIFRTEMDINTIPTFTAQDEANLLAAQAELDAVMALNLVMSPASYLMADALFDNTAPTLGLSSNSLTANTEAQADIAKEVQSLINAMASFGATEGSMYVEDQTYSVLTPITVPN